MARAAARLFRRLERRHWIGLGASAALHLAVFLGWQVTPPEPEAVSFEVSFDPPDSVVSATEPQSARPVPATRIARKTRAKSPAAPQIPDASAQREAHLLDANWRTEHTAARDAPALALPDARGLGIRLDTSQLERSASPVKPLAAKAALPAESGQPNNQGGPELAEPQATPVAGRHGQSADTGLALTNTATLSASRNLDSPIGGAGAQTSGTLPSPSAAAVDGPGDAGAGLNTAATVQTARNLAAGPGPLAAADSSVAAQAAASRSDAPGTRLTASGGLASSPLPPAGEGTLATQPPAAMLAVGDPQSGSAPSALQASASESTTGAQPAARHSGSAPSSLADSGASRAGRATQAAGGLVAVTAAPTPASGDAPASGRPGSSGQVAAAIALKPGEPGSRPSLAVAMQPVVASAPGAAQGPRSGRDPSVAQAGASRQPDARIGHASPVAGGSFGGDTSPPRFSGVTANIAAVSGGAPGRISPAGKMTGDQLAASRAAASAMLLEKARESGRAPMVLQAIHPVAVKVVRPDSEIQRLDVLAPSNYCPLPLAGHEKPDNRAPLPERQRAEQPAYAADNPSIHYPVLANIRGVEGRVTVRVEVLPDGRPGKMWLKQSSGSGILDQDALAQLKTWRYQPAHRNGQPVSAWIDVPVLYRLSQAR